ncbi:site-specific integrase [Aestuariibaculum suncheonense]|uniref:Site-specific integrase n=1 Tax=Aestuariibaculum suncheonense TaxID=1028745 RepID=A0A8J6Q7U2_9FLAO|nr:site-specific integrase [Aestuariibaculum suncheonense]MBD0835687.1 site-specific integrase [Aestuariibaculum suncheonense]
MKSKNTFTVIFFTRKSRSNPQQLSIYVRITVSGKRSEISLKRSVLVKDWDSNKSRAKGSSVKIKALNAYLDEVFGKLLNCHKELLFEDVIVSSDSIKARYLGEDETSKTLRDLVSYHHDKMGTVLKPGTMKNYYTTEKYLYEFLQNKRKSKDIYLKQLNYEFVTDFDHYLRHVKNSKKELMLSNNGVMKHLERFKKILNLGVKLEWMLKNPFSQFKLKYNKYDRAYLTERELRILESTEFKSERLERVKDCFVFSCYTGLSYVDVKELTVANILRGIDNNLWIYTKREKTDENVKVPVLPKALDIIKKYSQDKILNKTGNLLPISSNQKTNSYLKEIATDCGIHKNLTFHVARHTFATTVMLSNGVPIETVSKLLGHTKLTTTQIYARVVESKISKDINSLLERLEDKGIKNFSYELLY